MTRRQPPTSLRLHQGPLPTRGYAKHTLPSVPRPVHVPTDVSRTVIRAGPEPRVATSPSHSSVYACRHAYSSEDVSGLAYGQPRRRPVERGCNIPGALPVMPSSSGIARRSSFGTGAGYASSSSSAFPSPSTSPRPSPSSQPPTRGPWDHSRAVSLPIDVGSVLALPKPVAISP